MSEKITSNRFIYLLICFNYIRGNKQGLSTVDLMYMSCLSRSQIYRITNQLIKSNKIGVQKRKIGKRIESFFSIQYRKIYIREHLEQLTKIPLEYYDILDEYDLDLIKKLNDAIIERGGIWRAKKSVLRNIKIDKEKTFENLYLKIGALVPIRMKVYSLSYKNNSFKLMVDGKEVEFDERIE